MSEQTPTVVGPKQSDEQIRAQVQAIVLDLAPNPDGLRDAETALVQDLGFHSLALMELAFALEDEFDLEPIDEKTARSITTLGAVQAHVLRRIAEREAGA
ncbi:acyl carrier protein [Micromonospora sp. Llam7]|uniref:acyl carrier protein n=1 Tax=Micromonospora tarapacensis TaxID=2835305 RepID=UPI001C840078|nr:acyl carrier protein [Micromonospora tarapacensis]MBX7266839.1 acyl carrier protein [Micromonospora tarapacensis]